MSLVLLLAVPAWATHQNDSATAGDKRCSSTYGTNSSDGKICSADGDCTGHCDTGYCARFCAADTDCAMGTCAGDSFCSATHTGATVCAADSDCTGTCQQVNWGRIRGHATDAFELASYSDSAETHFLHSGGGVLQCYKDTPGRIHINGANVWYCDENGSIQRLVSHGTAVPTNLPSVDAMKLNTSKKIEFSDAGEFINSDGTNLTIASGADINLTATAGGDINIPVSIGLEFAGAEKIESDGTDLSITVGAGGDVNIPTDVGIEFGSGEKIEGDDTDLTITSGGYITLNGNVNGTGVLNEAAMVSNSAVKLATQQSIKTYVDAQVVSAGGDMALLTGVTANNDVTGTRYTNSSGALGIFEAQAEQAAGAAITCTALTGMVTCISTAGACDQADEDVTFTLRKNGAATDLTCTISSGGTDANSIYSTCTDTGSASFVATDRWSMAIGCAGDDCPVAGNWSEALSGVAKCNGD